VSWAMGTERDCFQADMREDSHDLSSLTRSG
jgi:hypothetical protein